MRRFGLDIKNSSTNAEKTSEEKVALQESLDAGKSRDELDAQKAARLARFGEVDPADLKRGGNQGG